LYATEHILFIYLFKENPNRDNVFYIEFPLFWDDQDLFNLFEPFGKIYISWINKSSAFIALKTLDNLKKGF
jgi:poly(A)-specific ribonuclease